MQDNISNSRLKIYILTGSILIFLSLSGYWLKCRIPIDFFEGPTLSRYFPFSVLAPQTIYNSSTHGTLLSDSFDPYQFFSNWAPLWMKEKGAVVKILSPEGIANSHCLVVKSTSNESWSSFHRKFIRVKKGDILSFRVLVKLHGKNLSAFAGVASFDESLQVISWNYLTEKTYKVDAWVILEKTFTIDDKISYVRFKLAGKGIGEFRFDNVFFLKKSNSPNRSFKL